MATTTYSPDPGTPDAPCSGFWRERHLYTPPPPPRRHPHIVPVGVTYDLRARPARVITNKSSAKTAHAPAVGPQGTPVAVCQVDGRRWAAPEGRGFVRTEPDRIAEAEPRRAAPRRARGAPLLERSREPGGERAPGPDPPRVATGIVPARALGRD
ncbi:nitrilase [Streptomyces sp. NTH33]|uniref:nitrilase n=1 Tax=Streptomyces sp. NTH33 TaxID=1735453 RepID=UPI000DAAAAF1|nr:nitrilase [Streptomyces sp. NTH33]PZG84509.1 nitrilase [Streptomyces sp. NTH33]